MAYQVTGPQNKEFQKLSFKTDQCNHSKELQASIFTWALDLNGSARAP